MRYILLVLFYFTIYPTFSQRTDKQTLKTVETEFSLLNPVDKEKELERMEVTNLVDKANSGDESAMHALAIRYMRGERKEYTKAYSWLLKAVNKGEYAAYIELGYIYKLGLGKSIDYEMAYKYFCDAADNNITSGYYLKGYMEYKGLGCLQNYKSAIENFEKAALNKNGPAMYMLALCYGNGYGVERDNLKAKELISEAKNNGYFNSQTELISKEPENNPNAIELLNKITNAKTLADRIDYPLNKFSRVYTKVNLSEIETEFEGFLLKYDWSKSIILSAVPLTINLKIVEDRISGTWLEEGMETPLPIKGTIIDEDVYFYDMTYKRPDYFHQQNNLFYEFKRGNLEIIEERDETFLTGNIDLYVPALREPQKPSSFILVNRKTTKDIVESTKLLDEFKAFPNPFDERIEVSFKLNTAGNLDLKILSSDGKLIYDSSPAYLEKGNYIYPISLSADIPSGTYFIVLEIEDKKETFKIIKSKK